MAQHFAQFRKGVTIDDYGLDPQGRQIKFAYSFAHSLELNVW